MLPQLAKECMLSLLKALVLGAQFTAQTTYARFAACGGFVRTLTVAELEPLVHQLSFASSTSLSVRVLQVC
jgi:hypothetical protein